MAFSFWKRRTHKDSQSDNAPIEPVLRQEPLESPDADECADLDESLSPRARHGARGTGALASTEALRFKEAGFDDDGAQADEEEDPNDPTLAQKRRERLAARLRARRRRLAFGTGKALLILLIALGVYKGAELAKTLPLFNLSRLVLEGDEQKVPIVRMKEAVEGALTGNYFTADLDRIRTAAERVPWVKHASVKRVWPGTIEIAVDVYEAMALYEDGRLVSREGVLFAANPEEASEARALPSFYGNARDVKEIAARYRRFGKLLEPLHARITDMILSDRGSWSIVFESDEIPPTKVELGQPQGDERNPERLAEKLAEEAADRIDQKSADGALLPDAPETETSTSTDTAKDAATLALDALHSAADAALESLEAAKALISGEAEKAEKARLEAALEGEPDDVDARLAAVVKSYPLVLRVLGGPPSSIDARYERAFAAGEPDRQAIAEHAERVAEEKRLEAERQAAQRDAVPSEAELDPAASTLLLSDEESEAEDADEAASPQAAESPDRDRQGDGNGVKETNASQNETTISESQENVEQSDRQTINN